MGRLGVSENQVFQAAEQLAADGVRPTVDTVRIALGNTGSRSTINKHLKAWRERHASRDVAGANLGSHLRQVIAEQAELLLKALAVESGANELQKTKKLESALSFQRERNQQLEIMLSECRAQLTTLPVTSTQEKLPQLRQDAELADLRDQNQMYREALVKEIARRETLDRQLVVFQEALKAAPGPKDEVSESHGRKGRELQALQQRDRDQRALIKDDAGKIKKLNLQLKEVRTQHDKDFARLSRALSELARLIK
jgi:hypothetical protein